MMRKSFFQLFAVVAFIPFLIQCATTKDVKTLDLRVRNIDNRLLKMEKGVDNLAQKNSVEKAQEQLAQLNVSIERLQKELLQVRGFWDETNRTFQLLDEKNVGLENKLAGSLGNISGKMNNLTQKLEQASFSLEEIKAARLREETERVIREAKEAERAAAYANAKELEALQSNQPRKIKPSATKKKIKGVKSSTTTSTRRKAPGDDVFEKGSTSFKAKKFSEAYSFFTQYLKKNPNGPNVAEARFLLGECFFKRNEYEMAILEYQRVIDEFRKSSEAAPALLMQGIAFEKLNDVGTAKMVYYKLLDEFPKSGQAVKAQKRLDALN